MPLLFESGSHRLTRPRVLVAADPATQLQRLVARDGLSEAAAAARIAAQMPLESKVELADIIIDNNGSLDELRRKVEGLGERLRGGRGVLLWGLLTSPLGLGLGLVAARVWVPRLLGSVLFRG